MKNSMMSDTLSDIGEVAEFVLEPIFGLITAPLEFVIGSAIDGFFHPITTFCEAWQVVKNLFRLTVFYLMTPILAISFFVRVAKYAPDMLLKAPFAFLRLTAQRTYYGALFWLAAPIEIVTGWLLVFITCLAVRWEILSGVSFLFSDRTTGAAWFCEKSSWCISNFGAAWRGLIIDIDSFMAGNLQFLALGIVFLILSALLTVASTEINYN